MSNNSGTSPGTGKVPPRVIPPSLGNPKLPSTVPSFGSSSNLPPVDSTTTSRFNIGSPVSTQSFSSNIPTTRSTSWGTTTVSFGNTTSSTSTNLGGNAVHGWGTSFSLSSTGTSRVGEASKSGDASRTVETSISITPSFFGTGSSRDSSRGPSTPPILPVLSGSSMFTPGRNSDSDFMMVTPPPTTASRFIEPPKTPNLGVIESSLANKRRELQIFLDRASTGNLSLDIEYTSIFKEILVILERILGYITRRPLTSGPDLDGLKNRYTEAEKERFSLNEEIRNKESELTIRMSQLDQLKSTREDFEEKLRVLQTESSSLKTRLDGIHKLVTHTEFAENNEAFILFFDQYGGLFESVKDSLNKNFVQTVKTLREIFPLFTEIYSTYTKSLKETLDMALEQYKTIGADEGTAPADLTLLPDVVASNKNILELLLVDLKRIETELQDLNDVIYFQERDTFYVRVVQLEGQIESLYNLFVGLSDKADSLSVRLNQEGWIDSSRENELVTFLTYLIEVEQKRFDTLQAEMITLKKQKEDLDSQVRDAKMTSAKLKDEINKLLEAAGKAKDYMLQVPVRIRADLSSVYILSSSPSPVSLKGFQVYHVESRKSFTVPPNWQVSSDKYIRIFLSQAEYRRNSNDPNASYTTVWSELEGLFDTQIIQTFDLVPPESSIRR
eukprot:TRINITY_DN649_c0_g7_i1.p1 TRINITY_DN649_c0_g7~~TRINITY_DN649_c0_g7_i1.p1  ORF type:complete len:671 (+),score=103.64 TRINITY_DN649_c0_g7_i1:88-2100(+)